MGDIILGIGTAIIGVMGTLSTIWLKHYLDVKKKSKDCIINKTIEEDQEILSKMDDLIKETNADRICIFQFHNGGEYYSGKSMQKFSCTYESVKAGISRIQLSSQNIPVSACMPALKSLMENNEFYCRDIEKNYPDSACKYSLIENGVKSTYQYGIFNLEKKAIGVLRADFIGDKKTISNESEKSLKVFAIKLPGYLVK